MTFRDRLDRLPPRVAERLQQVLRAWRTLGGQRGQRAAENLEADVALPETQWVEYMECLAGLPIPTTPAACEAAFVAASRGRQLQGIRGKIGTKALVGRAVLLPKYIDWLFDYVRKIWPPRLGVAVRATISRQLTELLSNPNRRKLPEYEIIEQAIQATQLGRVCSFAVLPASFADSRGPWEFDWFDAGDIRDSLGLGEDAAGQDYLLFTYQVEAAQEPRVPTSIDPGWNYQRWFCPNSEALHDGYGLTKPLSSTNPAYRRPEIVHHPVVGSSLKALPNVAYA
jgi:hypothetical protein